jgi:hypothetical protein
MVRCIKEMAGIDGVKHHDENLGDRALLLPLTCSCEVDVFSTK